MSIEQNIRRVQERMARAAERAGRSPAGVTLVAVTKSTDAAGVRRAFEAGLRCFGENRVQEAERKLAELADLRAQTTWHMVGTLQSNKAQIAARLFDTIQSVDSVRLAERLDRVAPRSGAAHPGSDRGVPPERRLPVYLEVNVAGEASKHGFTPDDVAAAVEQVRRCANLGLQGLMTIAPLAANPEDARPVFRRLRELAQGLGLAGLSMGMTDDFEVAIEEGATVVRIGRAIFNE
jgi:pyridoxal phosphate enzyme (YggS family)